MQIESPKTITVDGVEHEVEKFSDKVKQLVGIHTRWRTELLDARLEVAKTEAAIRSVEAELSQNVAAELNPEVPEAETPAAEQV